MRVYAGRLAGLTTSLCDPSVAAAVRGGPAVGGSRGGMSGSMARSARGTPIPIYLFSLPRSGSTLCQRILGSHPEVATVNEPHLLLPLLHSSRTDAVRSTYGHVYAAQAVQDFCAHLPGGEDDYLNALADLVRGLYRDASPFEGRYFLDKTPKYHLLTAEIIRLFPEGKFLFLWRNPLAVLSSIIETWGDEGAWNVFHFKVDLYQGLDHLVETFVEHQDRVHGFRYEDAIVQPEQTSRRVFAHLELPVRPRGPQRLRGDQVRGARPGPELR